MEQKRPMLLPHEVPQSPQG